MTSGTGRRDRSRPTSDGGFTMIELLVTISIIFFLFSILIVAAGPARERSKRKKSESLIAQVELVLGQYHSKMGHYPSDGIDETVETEDGTRLKSGAALTFAVRQPLRLFKKQPDGSMRAMGEEPPVGIDFKEGDLTAPYLDDPDARELLDGFGEPFHYDRVAGGERAFSVQDDGDVHLGWEERGLIHGLDPREAAGVAVDNAGAQNIGEFDMWSHGVNGHTDDEEPGDVIGNWRVPGGAALEDDE